MDSSSDIDSGQYPFFLLSDGFFFNRGRLCATNKKRDSARQSKQSKRTQDDNIVFTLETSNPEISSTFEAAITHLDKISISADDKKSRSIVGCKAVLEHIQKTSPVISVRELIKVYQKEVGNFTNTETSDKVMKPAELQERFRSNDIIFVLLYVNGEAFTVFPHSRDVDTVLKQVKKLFNVDALINQSLYEKLGEIFNDSLQMLSTKQDKDIVRSLFTIATSAKFTAKLQGK